MIYTIMLDQKEPPLAVEFKTIFKALVFLTGKEAMTKWESVMNVLETFSDVPEKTGSEAEEVLLDVFTKVYNKYSSFVFENVFNKLDDKPEIEYLEFLIKGNKEGRTDYEFVLRQSKNIFVNKEFLKHSGDLFLGGIKPGVHGLRLRALGNKFKVPKPIELATEFYQSLKDSIFYLYSEDYFPEKFEEHLGLEPFNKRSTEFVNYRLEILKDNQFPDLWEKYKAKREELRLCIW